MERGRIILALILLTGAYGNMVADDNIPEPYCSIKDLPFDPHGWFSNATPLEACLHEQRTMTVIEVGSWLGASTRFIASKIPEGGKLYAIDTWLGSPGETVHSTDPRIGYLYQQFLSNVKHAGLTKKIIPIRMRSLEAVKALNVMADLIYIDAAHDEDSVYNDIIAWSHHLKGEGIMCGDDWLWPTVRKGVMRAAAELRLQVMSEGNFWRMY